MRRGLNVLGALALAATLSPAVANAAVDVEVAFDPAQASPGTRVTLSGSIQNLDSQPVTAVGTIAVSVGDKKYGPFPARVRLGPSETRQGEVTFIVPNWAAGKTVTLSVRAVAAGSVETASATLTVLGPVTSATDKDAGAPSPAQAGVRVQQLLATPLIAALGGEEVPVAAQETTFSAVKQLYRAR